MCENVWEAVLPWAGVASTSLLTERPICSRVKHPLISLCQNDQVCFATGPPTQKHTHTQTHSHTQSPGELSLLFTHADAHIKMCMKSEKFRRTHRHTSTLSLSLRLPLSLVTAREQGETWALAGEVPRCQLTDIITGAVSKINPPPHFYLLPPVARFPRAPPSNPALHPTRPSALTPSALTIIYFSSSSPLQKAQQHSQGPCQKVAFWLKAFQTSSAGPFGQRPTLCGLSTAALSKKEGEGESGSH